MGRCGAKEACRGGSEARDAAAQAGRIESASLDRELLATVRDALPSIGGIAEQTAALDAYVESTKRLLGFLAFGKKSAAAKVLGKFGLQPSSGVPRASNLSWQPCGPAC